MMKNLCFATRNLNKLQEIRPLLPEWLTLVSLDDINCSEELPETSGTIPLNSAEKAQYIWDKYQINCFADDSGLEVAALDGAPGVDSAFYSGSRDFAANIELLLKNLKGKTSRKARFVTVISLIWEGRLYQFEGIVEGEILQSPRGEGGFGYDPIFLPEGFAQTFAEMPLAQKNQISHRSQATQQLIDYLQNLPNT